MDSNHGCTVRNEATGFDCAMLTEIEQKQLINTMLGLEKIIATIKQWPWLDPREKHRYTGQPKRPERLPPEMAATLHCGRCHVNYGYTLLLHRCDQPQLYLNVVTESADESELIYYGSTLLSLLKRAGFLPYRTGSSVLPLRAPKYVGSPD